MHCVYSWGPTNMLTVHITFAKTYFLIILKTEFLTFMFTCWKAFSSTQLHYGKWRIQCFWRLILRLSLLLWKYNSKSGCYLSPFCTINCTGKERHWQVDIQQNTKVQSALYCLHWQNKTHSNTKPGEKSNLGLISFQPLLPSRSV